MANNLIWTRCQSPDRHFFNFASDDDLWRAHLLAGRQRLVDVVDPGGVVRSQAIESESDAFRMALNGAENNRTVAGRFVEGSFGSSVQHLALSTADILSR